MDLNKIIQQFTGGNPPGGGAKNTSSNPRQSLFESAGVGGFRGHVVGGAG